jgi:hypothetical protein
MNEFQYHTTSTALGQGNLVPTPLEITLDTEGDDFSLTVRGSDGQQVTDVIVSTIAKMPGRKQPDRGITEFIVAFAAIAILFLLALQGIFPKQSTSPATQPMGAIK